MGWCLGQFIRLLGMTLRREVVGDLEGLNGHKGGLIFVLWHNQILASPYLWRRCFPERDCVVLTSASKDGVTLAAAVKVFGVKAVHGSSSRRAVAALVALLKAAKAGNDLVFTPDGPRGPKYALQPGAIKLAEKSGGLIVPFRVEYESAWVLKTWDAFRVPKPFSKVRLTFSETISVPKGLDEDRLEKYREELEAHLREGLTD